SLLTISSSPAASFRRRDFLLVLLLGVVLAVVSALPAASRRFGWICPEWSLMLALFVCYRAGMSQGCLAAFFLGCVQDGVNVTPEGIESVGLILGVVTLHIASEWIKINSFVLLIIFVSATSLLKNIIIIPIFLSVIGMYSAFSGVILFHWIIKAIITGLAAIPALELIDRLTKNPE
ncbi:MAG: rod shape-determining protein MreD, partial [Deltaproteobacteria bacterium]|nr:rod shape-determining protein MreD [Deltaproteobacteria bacterium]